MNRKLYSLCLLLLIYQGGQNPVNAQITSITSPQLLSQTTLSQTTPEEKTRIAVLDFDFSAISNPSFISLIPGGQRGVSDVLVNKLVQNANYSVIERSQIDKILAEQNLGASGRVDASTAAQIGRILGVEAVIIGSVTQFDVEKRTGGGGFLGIGASTQETEAFVKVNVRIVSTTTAEILTVVEGNGKANQSDTQVSVLGIGGGTTTNNDTKLLTAATEQAVDVIVSGINSASGKLAALPKPLPTVEAVVADITGRMVTLNKGKNEGYRVGMRLSIERVTKQVKDPQTGKVIRNITQSIGMVEITEVDGVSSVGAIISGAKFKVGDVAKPVQ